MFTLKSDWRKVKKELDRLADLPGAEGAAKLDFAQLAMFTDVYSKIHVRTRALRGSAKAETKNTPSSWKGTMEWGGASPGFRPLPPPRHPRKRKNMLISELARQEVIYAWFEKRRGFSHDYLRDNKLYEKQFLEVIESILKGGR